MARTHSFLALAAVSSLAACAQVDPELAAKHNPTLYSVHQPVVQRTDFVLDLSTAGNGLAGGEAQRLRGWLNSLGVGYGDRIAIDAAGGYGDAASRDDIAGVIASYGLLLSDGAPVTAGTVQPGAVRVVVSRMTASVPGCPDWSYAQLPGAPNSTDSNYGCATNSNLAAMIADPNDLVLGQAGASSDGTTGSKAVKAYRDRVPSGASGEVKPESVGGN